MKKALKNCSAVYELRELQNRFAITYSRQEVPARAAFTFSRNILKLNALVSYLS